MDSHSIELLEFEKIVLELSGLCFSAEGRKALAADRITSDPQVIEEKKTLSSAFRKFLESGRNLNRLDFPNLATILPKLAKKGVRFELEELAHLGRFIVSSLRLKRLLLKGSSPEQLAPQADRIPDLKYLVREIFKVVDREGNVLEHKIPELIAIRRRLKALQKEVAALTQGYLLKPAYRSFWQSNLPTTRNGRTVLALKVNFKGRIKGIVHEISGSGATAYLEPFDVVEKNNRIIKAENDYQRELNRLLRIVSERVIVASAGIYTMIEIVAALDTLYARAVYALQHNCTSVQVGPGQINLREARHPLLGRTAVPVSVHLGRENRVLIITGPNTGGKTVTLKTVGLLAMMHQFGMEIPVGTDSVLCIFDDIFADIGDEQSIEQSLSTFSSHIKNIARIIERSSAGSLVLLDELGAGTDPEEGVAIAMSFLDHFIAKGCFTLTTTHHGILKNYGYSRSGVENAAMEFDLKKLTPTFRLLLGIPGDSHALEIARRSGIPASLIDQAENYLRDERGDVAELIKSLSTKQRELLHAEREHQSKESILREKWRESDLKELHLRRKELSLREQGLIELKSFLKQSRKELDELVFQLKKKNDLLSGQRQDYLGKLETAVHRWEDDFHRERSRVYSETGQDLQVGIEVVIGKTGKRGKILRKGKGEHWIVETDTLRAAFPPTDLRRVPSGSETPGLDFSICGELKGAVFQIDLRGLRMEEALQRLEKQIDAALIQGLSSFGVIHGKGQGILQKGIHQYLARQAAVTNFHFAAPEDGGSGKTLVSLG